MKQNFSSLLYWIQCYIFYAKDIPIGKTFADIFVSNIFLCPKSHFYWIHDWISILSQMCRFFRFNITSNLSLDLFWVKKWKLFICMESRDQNEYIDGKTCRDESSGELRTGCNALKMQLKMKYSFFFFWLTDGCFIDVLD